MTNVTSPAKSPARVQDDEEETTAIGRHLRGVRRCTPCGGSGELLASFGPFGTVRRSCPVCKGRGLVRVSAAALGLCEPFDDAEA